MTLVMRDSMSLRLSHVLSWIVAFATFSSGEAMAQTEPAGGDSAAAEPEMAAPVLREHAEAVYPPDALKQRKEGSVGLALTLDEGGAVQEVEVTTPAGFGFDEAAVVAARKFIFDPARRGGRAMRATVHFTYRFQLPAEPAPGVASSAAGAVPAAPGSPRGTRGNVGLAGSGEAQTGSDQATIVVASRPRMAASSLSIPRRDLTLRPVAAAQDLLRATPGLVVVQHSGGGKANQYFLRGFDADHGTDVALSFDGVPINMVTHAHGQGFADTNFIIPEVVERLDITKGPYFANQSDFATAGAMNFVSRDDLEHASLGFGVGGSPGHGAPSYRGLVMASPKTESTKSLLAAEIGRQNGPFDRAEAWDRYKLMSKLTVLLGSTSSVTLTAMSYAGNWNGSGQLPARAIASGLVPRYGSLDPSEGGSTARHQAFLQYQLTPSADSELKALAYVGSYRFNLFSNFTFALRDPVFGDAIEQVDRRTFYGGKVSYRTVREVAGVKLATTIGGDMRGDQIRAELWNDEKRSRISPVGLYRAEPTSLGAFANAEVTPFSWLRFDVGGRADLLSFAVEDRLSSGGPPSAGGVGAATQLSPKGSVVVTPVRTDHLTIDTFANYGHGFHSNDVRGAFASPAVTPLARAVGSEVGARGRILRSLDLTAALWQLDLETETVWIGDEGTTDVSGSTHREGVELDARYEPLPWLSADASVTFARSKYQADAGYGAGLALAPKQTWAGGLSGRHPLGRGTARYGIRFYGIGDRPASDDGALVARGFTQVDLHVGYRHRYFDIGFDVENLLDARYRSAQFATVGRLATEPAVGAAIPAGYSCGKEGRLAPAPAGGPSGAFAGCEDIHFTPAYPFSIRLMATLFLDPQ
jgi:TonB family protein